VSQNSSNVITVEIHGQQYPVRSQLAAPYVAKLAVYVDEKMTVAAEETATGDSLKVAVLAALNIADEYFRCRETDQSVVSKAAERAAQIEALIDRTLASDS
jgi:cell division protein ZapA